MKTILINKNDNYTVTISKIVAYCCNDSNVLNLSDQEALNKLQVNPYIWQSVREKYRGGKLDYKKREILYVIEIRFGIQFTKSEQKMMLNNLLCTFDDVAILIDAAKSRREI